LNLGGAHQGAQALIKKANGFFVEFYPLWNSSSPVTGLEGPREFQEVKVPRFHDNGAGWW